MATLPPPRGPRSRAILDGPPSKTVKCRNFCGGGNRVRSLGTGLGTLRALEIIAVTREYWGMKLLVIDDHPVFRVGLVALLQQVAADVTVLQAGGGAEALETAGAHPDLDAVLADLCMPGMDGMLAIQDFGKRHPALPVIVLSSSEDPQDVRRSLALGALGYIPKSASPETLLAAIRFVLAGNVYVPPLMLVETAASGHDGGPPVQPGATIKFTERQIEVLKLVCEGLPNKRIGQVLSLSDKTVKGHVTAIFRTLNVVNRTQAAAAARDLRLI